MLDIKKVKVMRIKTLENIIDNVDPYFILKN